MPEPQASDGLPVAFPDTSASREVLAVASVAAAVVVSTFPDAITPWRPTVVDPAYVVLDIVLYYTAPAVFARDPGLLVLGIVGASITFAAGTQLRRT